MWDLATAKVRSCLSPMPSPAEPWHVLLILLQSHINTFLQTHLSGLRKDCLWQQSQTTESYYHHIHSFHIFYFYSSFAGFRSFHSSFH